MKKKLFLWDLFSRSFRKRPRKSTYLFWLSQALTTPMEAPPLPWQEPEKVPFGTFPAPAKEGGGASMSVVRA